MKKSYYFIVLLSIFFSLNVCAETKSTDEAAVQKAYYDWCSAIGKAHGKPKVVVKYYAPDAILLPTLSNKIKINSKSGLDGYFKKLTSHDNIKCTTKKLITRMYKETAINTGLYDFSYTDNGKEVLVPARFTFVYGKDSGKWLIIKHHSSKMPE